MGTNPPCTQKKTPRPLVDLTGTHDHDEHDVPDPIMTEVGIPAQPKTKGNATTTEARVEYVKMTDTDQAWLGHHLETLPKPLQDTIVNTPELGYLPVGLSTPTLDSDGYPRPQRDFARMLLRKGR